MAGFGEPWEWTTDRNQRMESEYPELANTSADDVLGTDNYAVSQGRAPTQFSSTAMGLGAHSVVPKETEDNSWWGAIKRAGSSILALDTPISERLGYKVPEGSGPADELANFALEEATRPSNIAFSAIGAVLSASGVGAPAGAPILAGTAARITAGATARAAARGAAKNIAIGIGGRVAATGVEKVAEYAPEEIGPLAALASAGAGLYATRGRSGLTKGAAALAAGGIGYASPELAGGIAGGVLTSKAIGGFSSWKEAANSIESRAATQAEKQAAQLLEQAEWRANKEAMPPISYRNMEESHDPNYYDPSRVFERDIIDQFGVSNVAFKTGGDDVKALAIQVAKDVGEEIPADMAARARNAIASGEQNLLTNSAIELNNWRGVIGPDGKRIISPTARRRASPTFQNTPELKAADKAFKEGSIEGERRRVLTEAAQKETGKRATYVGETGEIRLRQNLKEARMIAEANADKGPIGKYLKGDDSALQAAADLRVSYSGTAYGYSAEGRAAQASATKAAKERLIADRAVYESATGTPPAPAVEAATTPKITAASRRAALRKKTEVKPKEPDSLESIFSVDPPLATVRPAATPRPGGFSTGMMTRLGIAAEAAASKSNYQEIPKGAETAAGRIVEPVPVAKEVNPYLATMRTKPGEPGYAAAVKRAESRWKAQQTIRAAANPAVEPPIASVETPAAPAAAQQVDTPVTPAAAGGGEVPPPPPRETATGGAPEFKGTPQSNRTYATWGDNAAHNQLAAKLDPIIEERLGQAAETTANVKRENKKLADIADSQAEKVREAALAEGKTELQADKIYDEEWNKAYSGERTKSKLDLPLTISSREADRIVQSFTRAKRAAPGDLFIALRVKEATRALDAITGKTQGAFKGDLETLKYWVNLMSPEDDLAYVKFKLSKKITFDPKNAELLETQEKLLKANPAFGADDIADGVPVGSAGRVATDEAAAPRQTGEPTASTTGEPTAPRETIIPANDTSIGVNDAGDPLFQRADGSVYRMRSDSPTTRPNGYPDFGGDLASATNAAPSPGAARAEAAAALPDAEAPRATGKGGGATGGGGNGRGKGGGDEGGGASSTGDDIEGVPEANDYGKSFRKSEQEIKEARGVNTFWNILTDVLAAPRSLKASFDLSGAGRQAAPYGYSHPGQALKAFKAQLKAYGSEAGYQESVERLANKPWADIRNEVVANSLVDQPLLNGERTFISKGLNKVPGFRASERAYATYLNELRDSAFEMMWRNSGLSLEELTSVTNVPKVKAWGDLINAATGHGDIGTLFNAKVAGNPILWAPNFLYSRVKLPWIALTQWHQNPEVAREAAKQLVVFAGVNGALLAGVNASGAASVELDPRSSDFGQMRIGNSRIDPWAGYRPIVNLVARLQSGETKSTTTGDISDPTNLKIVQDFLRNKMEPLSGEILNQILGSNSIGEPTAADTNMAIRLVAPLFLESMVRAINVGGPSVTPSENFSDQIASFGRNVTSPGGLKAAALTLPGVVGVGTATYEPLIKKMDRATLDRMSPQERNKFGTNEQRGLANLTPAEQQKAIPALAFRQMYEYIPSASQELSNYGSFSGFKRDKIREYAEYYMDLGVSKANAVLRAEQYFQNSGYQQIYQQNVNTLKYQWSEAHPGELAEEIEETYTINPRDRTFRPNAIQKAMAEPYLQKR